MKFLVAVLLLAGMAFAGSDSLTAYYANDVANSQKVVAQQPPFNYIHNVSLASADFVAPAGVTIQFIKVAHPGTVRVATWTDTASLYLGTNDFEPVNARRIFKTGTTADSIVVYGKR